MPKNKLVWGEWRLMALPGTEFYAFHRRQQLLGAPWATYIVEIPHKRGNSPTYYLLTQFNGDRKIRLRSKELGAVRREAAATLSKLTRNTMEDFISRLAILRGLDRASRTKKRA